ncbi:MAG: replication initiator protein [Microviridae sp.]|nr:MAG: replication initiator protein [Microviridae sp.]
MCDSPFYILPKAAFEKIPVPCGRCPPCKLRRVNSWVFRLLQEEKISNTAHFVTLTYDTRTVPISENGFLTLRKRDFQLFMKRLRKLVPDTIKYYAVGEYGTNKSRPHYHAIIFNVPDPAHFHTAWQLGYVHIGQVSTNSIAYTMKYIDKLSYKKLHARDDREPEFPLMSKSLGANYLSEAVINYHQADLSRLYVTKEGGHKIALPRYYRQKIYTDVQLKQQLSIIKAAADEKELLQVHEFQSLNYPSNYTYEDWKNSKAFGRYHSFYDQQLPREC